MKQEIPKVGLAAFNELAESHESHVRQVAKLEKELKHNRLEANSSPIAEPSVKAVSFKRNNKMKQEKIDMLQEAIRLVEEASQLVDSVMDDSSGKNHYEAYGKYGFNQLLGNGNPYDNSLFTLIEELETADQICEECGSSVQSPENTLCDPCNDKYENRCDEQENTRSNNV